MKLPESLNLLTMRKLGLLYLYGLLCMVIMTNCSNQSGSGTSEKDIETEAQKQNPSITISTETADTTAPEEIRKVISEKKAPPPPPKELILDKETSSDSSILDSSKTHELTLDSSLVQIDSNEAKELDSTAIAEVTTFTEVEIIREELLASYQVDLPSKDTSTSNAKIDSILSKQSDIQIAQKKSVTIEFWDHPLYSSQYSMNGKVLKLYGVVPDETVLIQSYEDQNYLIVNGTYFAIENSFSLRPLAAEVDSFIIYQLQAH